MIQTKVVGDYLVTGNKHIAIAVAIDCEADSHHFTIDPEVNNDAFIRACGWASPGIGEESFELQNMRLRDTLQQVLNAMNYNDNSPEKDHPWIPGGMNEFSAGNIKKLVLKALQS